RRRHTIFSRDWSSDVALPICIGSGARNQEVEQNLSLRRQQRTRLRLAILQRIQIDGQDVLQEMFGLWAGNGDDGTVLEKGEGHEIGRASCRERGELAAAEESA